MNETVNAPNQILVLTQFLGNSNKRSIFGFIFRLVIEVDRLLIFAPGCSLSTGAASANLGIEYLCSQVDLRTRAIPVGVSHLPLQSTYLLLCILELFMAIDFPFPA